MGTYGILVKFPGDKRGSWLGDGGYVTNRRVHAHGTDDLGKANRIAAQLTSDNPGTTFTVRKF